MSGQPGLVLAHHRCASAWLAGYVGACARMNGLALEATHLSAALPGPAADVILLANADYAFLAGRVAGGLHVIRDPLDLMVSACHSHRNTHPTTAGRHLRRSRRCCGRWRRPRACC
jgi:hypothetical protein